MKRVVLPGPAKDLAIGLFGGSFNPAHEGHLHVTETAIRRLRLDAVWWIVARGNPLKSAHGDFGVRLASANEVVRGYRHKVSDAERRLGLVYSIDTIRALKARAPSARFVWLMGADSLATFHHWKAWREIAGEVPIAVIARPGSRVSKASFFSRQFAAFRVPEAEAACLPGCSPPAWVYLRAREHAVSSTALRRTS